MQPNFRRLLLFRHYWPALAFVSGFVWDSLTLGRVVALVDLWILGGYYLGATMVLSLLSRGAFPQHHRLLRLILQFFFGGLFSALVVLYFKSAGGLATMLVVGLLMVILVANEFLANRYERMQLSWTLFTLCGIMLFNFLLPHIFHSLYPAWFYISTILALAGVVGFRHLMTAEGREIKLPRQRCPRFCRDLQDMAAPVGAAMILVALFLAHLIPPVPLVLKEMVICQNIGRQNGHYICQQEKQGLMVRLGLRSPRYHVGPGAKITCFAAVFAPSHVQVELEQRWRWWNSAKDTWQQQAVVVLPMVGGRRQGYRTYSTIHNVVRPGRWQVETALRDGAVLGQRSFFLRQENKGQSMPRQELVL